MHAQALLEVERRVVLMAVMIRPYLRLGNSLPFWYVGRYRYKKINSNRFFSLSGIYYYYYDNSLVFAGDMSLKGINT